MVAAAYGEAVWSSSADASGASGGASNFNLTKEASQAITNSLKFAASKSIRTSAIILASFNALAAFATAMGIIYGCYTYRRSAMRRSSDASVWQSEIKAATSPRPSGLFFIHTVEVYPLVLSLGITVQSIIFAGAQSIGLKALLSSGCTVVAILLLPALFIAPFIHLVFGVETAVRGLRSQFSPRRRWTVAICLGTISTFLLGTLLVAAISRAPDFCFASLLWIVKPYSKGILALFLGISVVLLIAIITIFVRLIKSRMVDPIERTAASRMIYYLILGFISNGFILPFFFSLTFLAGGRRAFQALNLSMVASVVANVNGLMVAGLHLFLRSNSASIGHNLEEYEHHKTKAERHEEDSGSAHAMHPVNGENDQDRARSDSITSLLLAVDAEGGQGPSSPTFRPKVTIPQAPKPTQAPSETSPSHLRKQSYSLFPNNPFAAAAVLPATTYSPAASKPLRDTFKPPPIVKPWLGRGHKRDSSIVSSATVQIGIRFSNVDDFQPRRPSDAQDNERPDFLRPSPLARSEGRPESEYSEPEVLPEPLFNRRASRDAKMKTLPPVPREESLAHKVEREHEQPDSEGSDQDGGLITLSPTVYTPQETPQRNNSTRTARMPSPMGVGFSNPTTRNPGDKHPPPRPNASTATTTVPSDKPWI